MLWETIRAEWRKWAWRLLLFSGAVVTAVIMASASEVGHALGQAFLRLIGF
jgi:hypothetical protein